MYIGLLSDTHGVVGPEFWKFLSPVDEIWHAGDFGGGLDTAAEIAEFKPLVGVYGNCDSFDLRYQYPEYKCWDCEGMSVLMMHIGGSPGHYYPRAKELIEILRPKLFVCGHSHILKVMHDPKYDMLYVNPGAAGIQGWHAVRTALRFRIEGGDISKMEVLEVKR
ncbi:MAG: metallophosphoesterase family protein [Bacteroidales bacterium]|nr:metallophosphoesterase family protein [Bacteroidales bacterium]